MEEGKKLRKLRESTGMNRREFCEYFEIPYMTETDWELGNRRMPRYLLRLMEYKVHMEKLEYRDMEWIFIIKWGDGMDKRQVQIIRDINNKQLVLINDIVFCGRQNINWKNVENYIKQYIGDLTQIVETQDNIYVGSDFPDEYTGSKDTARLKGTLAKAKANAAQEIPELVKIATNKRYQENLKDKHIKDAKYGWYRYDSYKKRSGYPV